MTFKAGQSGNPGGRRKGALNKRTELAKMLEPHAEGLVKKLIELALNGDATALRLCIERLIPKVNRESTGIEFQKNIPKLKDDILRAALDGRISIEDAERLRHLIDEQTGKSKASLSINTTCPIEAAKIYQQIMRGSH
ncbi:MAG: hypothetical protein LEGION0403_FIIPPAGN_02865 [Legionella sp.]|uniref:DUF5681 domain-containing protein n=1 Tax=Legionella sp. TaxID=459 RepID=UPI003D0FDECA